ncbi:MAG: sugar phosphate isomerase/epimerase [Bacteroidales bacterium]
MELGIFAKTFPRPRLEAVLDAVAQNGYPRLQFNMVCTGLTSLPDALPPDLPDEIARQLHLRNLHMAALSGTYNMIHPNKPLREQGLRNLKLLIRSARRMGTQKITLCTGTFDEQDMWKAHPRNNSQEAWGLLCENLADALAVAEDAGVQLLIEPELGNVVYSCARARQLLDEMQSEALGAVFDPANFFETARPEEIRKLISEGLDLLAGRIELAHAKDRNPDGSFTFPGNGILPFGFILRGLKEAGFDGDLVTHGLLESEAEATRIFLQRELEAMA